MKNDPQVTEVSDDGALLKRYRNEIVDLKRRLQEAGLLLLLSWLLLCSCSLTRLHPPPAGLFSGADHCHREGGALSAAPREGPTAEGAGRPHPEPDQAAGHRLQSGSCSQGNVVIEGGAVFLWALLTHSVLFRPPNAELHGEGRCPGSARLPPVRTARQNPSAVGGKWSTPYWATWTRVNEDPSTLLLTDSVEETDFIFTQPL